jgi:hypothetical protein
MLLHLIVERPRRTRERRARARKLRLFACACCRRVWRHLADTRSRGAVLVAERYADGLADESERWDALAEEALGAPTWQAVRAARSAWCCLAPDECALAAYPDAIESAAWATACPDEMSNFSTSTDPAGFPNYAAERRAQVPLLRCIFGNPIRQVEANPTWTAWNAGAVGSLAQAAYDKRDPGQGFLDAARLLVLADALEDAGCTNAEMLGHLRGPGPHARGCWVIDVLTGKAGVSRGRGQ